MFTSVDLFGWKLQFRGPEIHPLGRCVSTDVNHVHLEIFRAIGRGRYDYVSNFHLGTYRSGNVRCFVLYNNFRPSVCWRVCGPNPNDLVAMLKWALLASAAIVAVVILAWVAAMIAEAAAALIFVPLLALA